MSKLVEELRAYLKEMESSTFRPPFCVSASDAPELLAHIERLESEQAIACAYCGGVGEDHVTVPREPTAKTLTVMSEALGVEPLGGDSVDSYPITGKSSTIAQCYRAMINAATHGEGE